MDRISLKSYDIILEQYSNYNVIFLIDKSNFLNNDIIFAKLKSDFLLYCINNLKQVNTKICLFDVVCTCGTAALKYYGWKYKGLDKIVYLKNILSPGFLTNCNLRSIDNVVSLTTSDCSWLPDNIINNIFDNI
jgi:hypothetical protein